jgi:hypothetical protein
LTTLSPKETQRIEKNIITRLYERDLEKYQRRKGSNQADPKKFDYETNLRNEIYSFENENNLQQKRGLTSVKSKSSLSIENNSSSNRQKNSANFTFNKPTSGRSIHNYNHLAEEEINFNSKDYQDFKNHYAFKDNQKQIKETSENREQDFADSLRKFQ